MFVNVIMSSLIHSSFLMILNVAAGGNAEERKQLCNLYPDRYTDEFKPTTIK